MSIKETATPTQEILEWVKFREEENEEMRVETFVEKFQRKFKENPFVPIGALVTLGCLSYGLVSFKRGDSKMGQYMMRARVAAQGFTVAALVGGLYLTAAKKSNISND